MSSQREGKYHKHRTSAIPILLLVGALVGLYVNTFYPPVVLEDKESSTSVNHKDKVPKIVTEMNKNSISSYAKGVTGTDKVQPDWQTAGQKLARVYPPRKGKDLFGWCVKDKGDGSATGLLFVKLHKCASTTGSSVSYNVAHHVAHRTNSNQCKVIAGHSHAQRLPIRTRDRETSLLWTLVRHPAKRSVSGFFYFQVHDEDAQPREKDFMRYLRKKKNYQLDELRESRLQNYTLEQIIHEMDFIGVAERLDESLVVFRLLFGMEASDIVVLSSKQSGSFVYDYGESGCRKTVPSFVPPAVQDYLSTSFEEDNLDYVLYAAANASLDNTIDAIGRDTVMREVKRHRYLQQIAENECLNKAHWPCSEEGVFQEELSRKSCYHHDNGCGHECVDVALSKKSLKP